MIELRVFGTGHPLPPDAYRYYGTALVAGLVWHLYGRGSEEGDGG